MSFDIVFVAILSATFVLNFVFIVGAVTFTVLNQKKVILFFSYVGTWIYYATLKK